MSRESSSLFRWSGVGLLVLASAGSVARPEAERAALAGLLVFAGAILVVIGSARQEWVGDGGWRRVRDGVILALIVLVGGAISHVVLESVAVRTPRFTALGHAVGLILQPILGTDSGPGGTILVEGPEGALVFAPTASLIGLVPHGALFLVACLVGYLQRETLRAVSWAGLTVSVMSLARACMNVVGYLEHDSALTRSAPSHLRSFSGWEQSFPWIIAGSLFIGYVMSRGRDEDTSRELGAGSRVLPFAAFVGAATLTLAVCLVSHGGVKQGRILVDDRLSGTWAPSARRLTSEWFGDFSTYSFASAAEYLGYYYPTTVNPVREYTDSLLEEFDVLILKTPQRDLAPSEEDAIRRFVHRGGGLLLVGDHTDLLGMSSRLNRLAALGGMRFRSDAVADGLHGGFTYYEPSRWLRHPAARHVDELEFMTGCSIALGEGADPVLVARDQASEPFDYAQSSFFGSLHSVPSVDYGSLALAAAGSHGRGRILCFADSTVLSSFALFKWNRDALLLDLVAFANTRVSTVPWNVLLGVAALVCLVVPLYRTRHSRRRLAVLWAAVVLGVPAGLEATRHQTARAYPDSVPARAPPRLSVLAEDTEAQFPAVLGSLGHRDPDWCYDTWYAAIQRVGVFPRLDRDLGVAMRAPAMVVLSPVSGIEADRADALHDWVDAGGHMIVMSRQDHRHDAAIASYLAPFTGDRQTNADPHSHAIPPGFEEFEVPSARIAVFRKAVGKGRVWVVTGAEWWSRERLGHCFTVPNTERRDDYATLARILEETGVTPAQRRTYRILGASE